MDAQRARRQLEAWLEGAVVGLNLCPFARPLLGSPALRVVVCEASDSAAGQREMDGCLLAEFDLLLNSTRDEVATTLLAFTGALASFDAYLDYLDHANTLLQAAGLEGIVQLASFHPEYQFAGEPAQAASHYSNRAPLPVIHLLREDLLEEALARWPNPERIPETNIARLNSIGRAALAAQLAEWQAL
ncbi:MAG: hypothetical protein CME43_05610 [Haliea sp.]|nr:hypothetical protein [Haliea sp.]